MKHLARTFICSGVLALTVLLAACGSSSSGSGSGKLDIAFLPKAVNNPYFDAAADGGKKAAGELSGTFKQVGPTNASAAEQVVAGRFVPRPQAVQATLELGDGVGHAGIPVPTTAGCAAVPV